MGKNISITLWGNCHEKQKWLEWYNEAKELFNMFGYAHTHIGIQSKSFQSKKILTVIRKEKEILEKIRSGEVPKSLSCYSLPKEFKVAMFDYDIFCIRREEYISFVLKEEDYNLNKENLILSFLKKYVDFEYGEIYSVSRDEVPMLYAETRDARNLDTYKFLKEIKK